MRVKQIGRANWMVSAVTPRLHPIASLSLPPRLVFFGMRCAFSVPPLAALLAAGGDVRAVVLPGHPSGPPVREIRAGAGAVDEVERLAAATNVPVLEVGGVRAPAVIDTLGETRPDLLVVACFPWKLPPAVLALARRGGLNVHPSLLPTGRGPEPVFWTLRRGERRTGATIHRLTGKVDAGPIVVQESMAVPEGIRAPDLERDLAEVGARLLGPAVRGVLAGDSAAEGTPQDDALATGAPVPIPADWVVSTNLPAGWAYGFVRGVAPLGGPLTLVVLATGERLPLVDALDHDPTGVLPAPYVGTGEGPDEVVVRFRPGTARLRLAPGSIVDSTRPRAGGDARRRR